MKYKFKIGDSVIVKKGVTDPDFGTDLVGRQGRIIEIEEGDDEPLICIKWGSVTLKSISRSEIAKSEKKNLDWTMIRLLQSEVDPAKPRDSADNATTAESTKRYNPAQDRAFLVTMTGEPYQPARVHYNLFEKQKVADTFSKLRCMDYDKSKQRWVWLYAKEAKKLKFARSYSSIPWRKRPIVLGSFFSNTDDQMFLNVNSFDRVTKAIEFFDKHLDRPFAQVTDIEIVNRFFHISIRKAPMHEDYFDKEPVAKVDFDSLLNDFKEKALAIGNLKERAEFTISYFEEMLKEPLPEVERIPTFYYEDGIESLELALRVRHIIAYQNWIGNWNYSFHNLMPEIMPLINGRTA
jgi:hypothetical protein